MRVCKASDAANKMIRFYQDHSLNDEFDMSHESQRPHWQDQDPPEFSPRCTFIDSTTERKYPAFFSESF